MRSAYKSQFQSQFTSATDTAWKQKNNNASNSNTDNSNNQDGSARKKSRWA